MTTRLHVVRDDDCYIFHTNVVGATYYFHFLVLPADATDASWTSVSSYLIRGRRDDIICLVTMERNKVCHRVMTYSLTSSTDA